MNPKKFTIGIIGGGQLGKMLTREAKQMDFSVIALDPTPGSPGGSMADEQIIGNFYDKDKIIELVKKCDVTTFEIEHIDTEVLAELEKEGHKIYPSPKVLEIIKDKSLQKEMLMENNIPTSRWEIISDLGETGKSLGFPFIQKSCMGGYDGRGVFLIGGEKDFENALKVESFGEEYIDFKKELAVLVSRDIDGKIKSFPIVEMVFDQDANICDTVIAPARVDGIIADKARDIAIKCIEVLEGVGVFAVEMFLTDENEILVNEIAPRVHNSGHFTIEACMTSQFQQHIRAICGIPLGETDSLIPSVVVNILGEEDEKGSPYYKGFKEALEISGVNIHIYGKDLVKPYRKMGHVTISDRDIEKAIYKAGKVKKILKAIAKEEDKYEK
ncbi:MAG: 5-(carboxyamino)imidazole ribonucleotide synthase [Eubacteriales bacterium]